MLKDNEYNINTSVINNINRQDNDSFCAKILIILLALKKFKNFSRIFCMTRSNRYSYSQNMIMYDISIINYILRYRQYTYYIYIESII